MAVGAVFNARIAIQLQPIIVLVLYAFTVIGINTHRIFDARQVVIVCAEKSVLVLLSCAFAWVLNVSLGPIFPPPLEFLATTALTLWFAGLLNAWLNRAFQAYPQVINARRAAFSAAGKEAQMEELVGVFLSILKGWGRSEHAIVLSGAAGFYQGGGIEISADSSESQLMKEIRWATPERLARERPSPARVALAKFLSDQNLGILVACDGPTLNALVGVGLAASRRPFTYPQVLQLLELAAIIANALERASLSAKAQHAAQLATVGLLGASLAHEIRNPLVAIKTFVQLLPQHYQDQAFRDKFFRVISDEVRRIDRLTEQLLDVAAPRVYCPKLIELHAVLRESLDLVAAKAAGFNVALRSDLLAAPDAIYTDPAAVKQVVLNLCLNAIQAVETQPGDRWIKIVSRNVGNNIELVISDSGPGIAPDIWPRLFETFQSSKSSGFGLGLAICRDILANVNATIVADQPIFGQGATFRVTFPCRP
jgi:signal transduction histidine kinase